MMEIDTGFSAWCQACGWNLLPSGEAGKQSRWQRRRARAAARYEDAVLVRAMREHGRQVRHDLRSRLAVGIAVGVHVLTVAVAAAGVWLGWEAARVPVAGLAAAACLAMAWALRPRLGRLPRDFLLTRHSHPAFFGLLDLVTASAGAPAFDYAVLNRDPNAATGRAGLRRHRVVFVGAALWSVLDWDERIAVLAHEAGHNVSNDSRRGYFLGSSLAALAVWIRVLTPKTSTRHYLQILFRAFVRWPLRQVAILVYAAQLRLSSGVSRRAEYRADEIAAAAAGTGAVTGMLDKLLVTGEAMKHLRQSVRWRPDESLWEAQKAWIGRFPAGQRARLRQIDQITATSVYSSHPSVSRRISYLSASPVQASLALPDAGQLALIEAELNPQLTRMADQIRGEVHGKLTAAETEMLPGHR
jgi:Zn-dependent protease with chaperone function